jgi:hypothetical protein
MTVVDLDIPPYKPLTDVLKPATDRVSREPSEHPERIPRETRSHPVTRGGTGRRERIGSN